MKNIILRQYKNWYKLILIIYFLITPLSFVYTCDPSGGTICNPLGDSAPTSIPIFIQTLLTGVIKIGIPIVALAIVYCGFLFVFARGNPEKLTKAKDALLWTLIGAAVLLGSWAIATMISSTVTGLGDGSNSTSVVSSNNSSSNSVNNSFNTPSTNNSGGQISNNTGTVTNNNGLTVGTLPSSSSSSSTGTPGVSGSNNQTSSGTTGTGSNTNTTTTTTGGTNTGSGTTPTGSAIPSAPNVGTATAGNSQVTITFTAPSSNGGNTITSYTVTASSGSGTKTATGPASPITVTGLTNGTPYTFTVTATNSAGTGASSLASNVVTPVATTTVSNLSTNIGPYYWGGTLAGVSSSDMISKAETLALSLNSKIIRIALSPTSDINYQGGSCISNFTLAGLASRSDFNQIISNPEYSTIVITAYDGITYGDCATFHAVDPTFYTADNTAKIEKEYHDLATYLKQFNKTFIISNWEGDNQIYCGGAYSADLQSCPDATNNIIGMQKWLQARTAGIASAGASNVFSGVEFNIVHALKDKGLKSILYDVLPNVPADYYLYSSYESSNVSAGQLGTDIDLIRSVLTSEGKNPSHLIIGELGNTDASKMKSLVAMTQQKNILYTFVWALLDYPSGFGIYNTSANLSSLGKNVFSSQ